MLAFAYSECGLTVDQFFCLSFYEWSLEIYKVKKRNERETKRWEGSASLTREVMALIANVNRGKNTPMFKGQDFIKLSIDDGNEIAVKEERTDEEILSKFPKNFKDVANGN